MARSRHRNCAPQPELCEQLPEEIFGGPWCDIFFTLEELREDRHFSPAVVDTSLCWATGLAEAGFPPPDLESAPGGWCLFVWEADIYPPGLRLLVIGEQHGYFTYPAGRDKNGEQQVEVQELDETAFWSLVEHLRLPPG